MNPAKSRLIQLNPGCASAPANKTKPPGPLCCHPVASLLPVSLPLKRLTDNEVTDVATFGTAIRDAGLTRVRFPSPPPFFRLVAPQMQLPIAAPKVFASRPGRSVVHGPQQPVFKFYLGESQAGRNGGGDCRDKCGGTDCPSPSDGARPRWELRPIKVNQGESSQVRPFIFLMPLVHAFQDKCSTAVTLVRLCGRGRPRSRSAPVLGR